MLKISELVVRVGDFELRDVNLDIADGEYFVILARAGRAKRCCWSPSRGGTASSADALRWMGRTCPRSSRSSGA